MLTELNLLIVKGWGRGCGDTYVSLIGVGVAAVARITAADSFGGHRPATSTARTVGGGAAGCCTERKHKTASVTLSLRDARTHTKLTGGCFRFSRVRRLGN